MTQLFDLSGRTALITGSARGIGFALAEGLATAGARVILNGTRADTVAEAVGQLSTRKKSRTSVMMACGSSQAAKCPPLA